METKTFNTLEKQLLDEHFKEYQTFTRHLLTISGGCLALLGALSKAASPEATSAHAATAAALSLVLFLISTAAGVGLQHQLARRPIRDRDVALALLLKREQEDPENNDPVILQRLPSPTEQRLYKLQLWSFVLAFLALTIHAIAR